MTRLNLRHAAALRGAPLSSHLTCMTNRRHFSHSSLPLFLLFVEGAATLVLDGCEGGKRLCILESHRGPVLGAWVGTWSWGNCDLETIEEGGRQGGGRKSPGGGTRQGGGYRWGLRFKRTQVWKKKKRVGEGEEIYGRPCGGGRAIRVPVCLGNCFPPLRRSILLFEF